MIQPNNLDYTNIPSIYHPLVRGIESLPHSEINAIIAKSKTGLGKSWWVDYTLDKIGADSIVFKGTISEARFFKFIQDNSDKIIVMRDCGSMLRRLTFLDFLKSATDLTKHRKISRLNYSNHEGVENEIDFTGKIIWEINDIPKKNREDLSAVIDRSLFIELNPSLDEIKKIMFSICKSEFEKEVTGYLISKYKKIGLSELNMRNQYKCFQIAILSVKDSLNWQKQLDMFLDTQCCLIRKLLYRLAGYKPVRRIVFIKYLIQEVDWSYATANRKVNEALFLGDLFDNEKMKQSLICLENKFEDIKILR